LQEVDLPTRGETGNETTALKGGKLGQECLKFVLYYTFSYSDHTLGRYLKQITELEQTYRTEYRISKPFRT
jgi:hypothetical protein